MTRLYLSLGSALLAAVSFMIVLGEPLSPDRRYRPETFAVKVSEASGSLILEWSPQSRLVQSATGGVLEYVDGGTPHRDEVDVRVLRQGALEYRRRSHEVLLRLLLLKKRDVIGQMSVRLTGAPAVAAQETLTNRNGK
ncbi:MAG: hypothetical protein SGI92_33690 [Bryobacteraceae bacterium]|nr:hypothetical protein [Bryobacteraceae bacterium]